jgi:hypothetical protein
MVMTRRLLLVKGQSNAGGLCIAANVNNYANFATPDAAIPFVSRGLLSGDPPGGDVLDPASGVRSLGPRLISMGGSLGVGTCGPEVSMGKELHRLMPNEWAVGQIWIDSSNMDKWKPSTVYPNTGPPFWHEQLLDQIEDIQLKTRSSLRRGAIAWFQGTSDAIDGIEDDYLTNITDMFTAIGERYCDDPDDLVISVDRISQQFIDNFGSPAETGGPVVRAAETSFVAAKPSRRALINTDDLELRVDNAHFADNSYATVGVRHAAAIFQLVASSGGGMVGPSIGLR